MSTLLTNELIQNALLQRGALLKQLIDPRRDVDAECGYPKEVTREIYWDLFRREGIARRVVSLFPEESWAADPEIVESEDAEDSEFEKAWKQLEKDRNLFAYMARGDTLSGIGRFGILILGVDDGLTLDKPLLLTKGGSGAPTRKLLYVRVFDEHSVTIKSFETEVTNERYGLPTAYTVSVADASAMSTTESAPPNVSLDVHWTRVIHLADNRMESEVFGSPRMEAVFNRLYDLKKVLGGSGEMYWKGGFPGMAIEVNPDIQDAVIDKEAMRAEFEAYSNGLQRYLALTGVTAKSLNPQVADPSPHVQTHLKAIATSLGVPARIFLGTEEAQLAGAQDSKAWDKRIQRRQDKYLSPYVVRPLVDRLIDASILPAPKDVEEGYKVNWPDIFALSDEQKVAIAERITNALAKYVASGIDQMIPPDLFLIHVMGMDTEEVESFMKAAEKYAKETEVDEAALAAEQAAAAGGTQPPGSAPNPAATGQDGTIANLSGFALT